MATLNTTNIKHASSSSNNIVLASDGTVSFATSPLHSYAILEDAKTHNTEGQSLTETTWTTRDLNRIYANPDSIVSSLSSNAFTLIAGTYLIKWQSPFYRTDSAKTRLYDVTNSAVKKAGTAGWAQDASGNYSSTMSHGVCRLTISGSTVYRLEYFIDHDDNSPLGGKKGPDDSGNTEEEIYTIVEIYKEA